MSLQNKYVRELRVYYWKTLFEAKEMQKHMTREVRGAYLAKIQFHSWYSDSNDG